jgi:hypothetical protein
VRPLSKMADNTITTSSVAPKITLSTGTYMTYMISSRVYRRLKFALSWTFTVIIHRIAYIDLLRSIYVEKMFLIRVNRAITHSSLNSSQPVIAFIWEISSPPIGEIPTRRDSFKSRDIALVSHKMNISV